MLDRGADVDTTDNAGWTPLHCAAQEGHVEVMKILMARGAQVDKKVSLHSVCLTRYGVHELYRIRVIKNAKRQVVK